MSAASRAGAGESRCRTSRTAKRARLRPGSLTSGAGGGALGLLQKAGIPEAKGYGGFPVSGFGCAAAMRGSSPSGITPRSTARPPSARRPCRCRTSIPGSSAGSAFCSSGPTPVSPLHQFPSLKARPGTLPLHQAPTTSGRMAGRGPGQSRLDPPPGRQVLQPPSRRFASPAGVAFPAAKPGIARRSRGSASRSSAGRTRRGGRLAWEPNWSPRAGTALVGLLGASPGASTAAQPRSTSWRSASRIG